MANRSGPPGSVLSEARELIQFFHSLVGDQPLVLEIGCNDGMHSRMFLEEIPGITLHCFEPDPRPRARWEALIGDVPGALLHPFAIAGHTGQVPWHASGGTTQKSWLEDWDLSGSIRKPTGHFKLSPWVTFSQPTTIECWSLDDWYREYLAAGSLIDLIFADVQGAERDLITGGRQTLRDRVHYLYSEFYDQPMYEGQLPLAELLKLLGPEWVLVKQYKHDFLARNTRLDHLP